MVYLFLAFVVALLVAVFAIQNSVPVTIAFFIWNIQVSLVFVILGAATFGAMVILLLAAYIQFKQRIMLQKAKQHQEKLEAEIQVLNTRLNEEITKAMAKNEL